MAREVPITITPTVKAYSVGNKAKTIVLAIPKPVREALGIKEGTEFRVKIDDKGRIIYEPVNQRR